MTPRTALRLGRVSNLPTVATNVLAGGTLAGAEPALPVYLGTTCAMSLFYIGGMFLNDAFDREHDALHRPDRPIPAGEARAREVFVAGFAMLACGTALLAALALASGGDPLAAAAAGLALGVAIVLYDARHKRNPLGPLLMALCRALIYVGSALVLVRWPLAGPLWLGAAALLLYSVLLTQLAKRALLGPRGVSRLIAGFCLLDAALLSWTGSPVLAAACGAGAVATLAAQRLVTGT